MMTSSNGVQLLQELVQTVTFVPCYPGGNSKELHSHFDILWISCCFPNMNPQCRNTRSSLVCTILTAREKGRTGRYMYHK
ncbi:hypothetical protein Pelo_639 [Pelomyxa schiedti]|nr:hypothetical protein Pelo_639 [Pelomyxa schiedti]